MASNKQMRKTSITLDFDEFIQLISHLKYKLNDCHVEIDDRGNFRIVNNDDYKLQVISIVKDNLFYQSLIPKKLFMAPKPHELKAKLQAAKFTLYQLKPLLGISEWKISQYLNGIESIPNNIEAKIKKILSEYNK